MATTPTMALSALIGDIGILIAATTSSGTDRLEIWRRETSGAAIRIAYEMDMIPPHGIHPNYESSFADYNVASGTSYTYFLRAVDGSGGIADSATASISFSLSQGILHGVTKTNRDANSLDSNGVSVFDLIPQQQGYNRANRVYFLANAIAPTQKQSDIEHSIVSCIVRIAGSSAATTRRNLRSVYAARSYVCYRDALGAIYFGRFKDYQETYLATYTDLALQIEILDYDESVNS